MAYFASPVFPKKIKDIDGKPIRSEEELTDGVTISIKVNGDYISWRAGFNKDDKTFCMGRFGDVYRYKTQTYSVVMMKDGDNNPIKIDKELKDGMEISIKIDEKVVSGRAGFNKEAKTFCLAGLIYNYEVLDSDEETIERTCLVHE